jgi:hypothetical protein
MTTKDIYDKIDEIKNALKTNPTIDTIYEIHKPNINKTIFRKINNPNVCYVEFQLARGSNPNEVELYVDDFNCEYSGKEKGEGLKMLRALVNYINKKADEQNIANRVIKLTSLPKENLINYYVRIGFNFEDTDDKDAYANNDWDVLLDDRHRDGPLMYAKFDDILAVQTTKKSKKPKKPKSKRAKSKSKKSKSKHAKSKSKKSKSKRT